MLRISVTTIESYRNYLLGTIEEDNLLNRIRGEYKPTKYMELGTAFHDILEKIQDRYVEDRKVFKAKNGIEFDYDIIARCHQAINQEADFELKSTKIYDLGKEQIEVVAKVDQLLSLFRQFVMKSNVQNRMSTLRLKTFAIGAYLVKDGRNLVLTLSLRLKRREWFTGLWNDSKSFTLPVYVSNT